MTLVRAAREGAYEKVVQILQSNPEFVDCADIFGETALHESIYNGHSTIALYLLDHGASPNLCRGDGNSPLHIAANKGRHNVATVLLQNESVRKNINRKDSLGDTALHAACKKTQVDLAQLLVSHGANVNYVNKRGQKPIDYTRDVRLYRILRGKQWYDDLDGDAIVDRLKNGKERVIKSPNVSPNQNKKKRKRRGGKNRHKNRKLANVNVNNGLQNGNGKQEQNGITVSDKKKEKRKRIKGKNKVTNKELSVELKTWVEFNDFVSVETLQKYQMIYLDRKLKLKWIHYMRCIRKENLKITEFNRKMCRFADGLYLEYSQPQYDCNHYIPKQLDEDDDSDF